MNGYKTKYLHYTKSGKSEVTIPRAVIEALNLGWDHGDELKLTVQTIKGIRGIFLAKDI